MISVNQNIGLLKGGWKPTEKIFKLTIGKNKEVNKTQSWKREILKKYGELLCISPLL
ncbi:MAG: hypothetical protein CM1200mP16_05190 [Nitrospina sp.]|nr:MAG: hypothetical protein CM1200mP16_05190 [Nitrospina sp.]